MEYPVDEHLLDWSGWDIRKALKLFAKSNPPLLEWIRSPIVYRDIGNLRSTLRALERTYFSPRACIHHYLHMAAGNYRDYLQGDTVRIKKYFYVLRPLLACEWIKDNGTPPPMEFASLTASQIPDGRLKDAVARLTSRKIAGEELSVEPQITLINEYIEDRIAYYTDYTKTIPRAQPEIELLDDVLRRQIKSL